MLDTGPAGTRDALVVVPPPCAVRLHCVDARDRSVLRTVGVAWSGFLMGKGGWVEFDEDLGCWSFRAPLGSMQLFAQDDEHEEVVQRVELRPGTNEITLRLNRYLHLAVLLRDGAETVAWRPSRCARLETLDGVEAGEGELVQGELELRVSQPSSYVLVVPDQPGYEPVPPRTLRIERDGAIDVALERKPCRGSSRPVRGGARTRPG